jgi:hypothetical protein
MAHQERKTLLRLSIFLSPEHFFSSPVDADLASQLLTTRLHARENFNVKILTNQKKQNTTGTNNFTSNRYHHVQ